MTHLPLDPLSCVALALLLFHAAVSRHRRRRERGHLGRIFRSALELGRNERGLR